MHTRHFLYARLDAIDCPDWIRLSVDGNTDIHLSTGITGASALVHASSLVCANDVSKSWHI